MGFDFPSERDKFAELLEIAFADYFTDIAVAVDYLRFSYKVVATPKDVDYSAKVAAGICRDNLRKTLKSLGTKLYIKECNFEVANYELTGIIRFHVRMIKGVPVTAKTVVDHIVWALSPSKQEELTFEDVVDSVVGIKPD